MAAAWLALILLLQEPSSFPLRPGTTWTWEGKERRLSAEAWDHLEVRGKPCIRLRFWSRGESKPGFYDELFLAEREGELLLAGYRNDDLDFTAKEPPVLLPKDPVPGRAWSATFENGSMDAGEFRWHDAAFRVEGKERSGAYEAWKIRWGGKPEAKDGFLLWIAPGTGIVRIDSIEGEAWTLGLQNHDGGRPDRFRRYPELEAGKRDAIDAWIRRLNDEDPARRAVAEQALRDFGPGAVPIFRERARLEKDAEVRGRLELLSRPLGKLRLQARALRPSSVTGEPLPVRFALVNDGAEPIFVLPCLPGSGTALGRKFPLISALVTDGAGKEMSVPLAGSFWGSPRLRGAQFRRLVPGESLDPFEEGTGEPPPLLDFRPAEPGTYTVRLSYDVRGETVDEWATDAGLPDEEARRLLPLLPRGLYQSDPVTITVVEKK